MSTSPGTILAIDLGTSSVKVLIVGRDGNVRGGGQRTYATIQAQPGQHEQQIEAWLEAIFHAIVSARRFAGDAHIDAIAVTGQMHGTVMYDENTLPLNPAVIWSDRRGASMMPELLATLGPGLPTTIGGPLGTGYMAVTLAWFRRNQPQVWRHFRHVALPVDAIVHALCGEYATDPSNAASTGLYNPERGDWDSDILSTLEIPREWLPQVVPAGSMAGRLTPRAAEMFGLPVGTPIHVAGGDTPAAAIGGGVLIGDAGMVTVSTGAQVTRPTKHWNPEPDGRWHTWPSALPPNAAGDRWLSVATMLSGGRAIGWIHRIVGADGTVADLLESARTVPAGADGLLFLPYLAGERTPLLDPYARGAFIGLSERHEPRHLVRAVVEGVCLAIADSASRLPQGETPPKRLILGGGGASPTFRTVLASMVEVPLVIPLVQSITAFGAACITGMAIGWWSAADVVEITRRGASTVQPMTANRTRYAELLETYRLATDSLLPIMHRLQELP